MVSGILHNCIIDLMDEQCAVLADRRSSRMRVTTLTHRLLKRLQQPIQREHLPIHRLHDVADELLQWLIEPGDHNVLEASLLKQLEGLFEGGERGGDGERGVGGKKEALDEEVGDGWEGKCELRRRECGREVSVEGRRMSRVVRVMR